MTNGNGRELTQEEVQRLMTGEMVQTGATGITPQELPPTREAVVEQGLRIQQETAAERDQLRRELAAERSTNAGFKVALEAMQAQLTEAYSRVETQQITTDQAVRRAAEVETVLASMLALGRAFSIKHQPHITGDGDEQDLRDAHWPPAGSGYSRDIG